MGLQSIRDSDGITWQWPRGIWNLLVALAYAVGESAYFGWNLIPKSGAEMACDGIALLLIIVTSERIASVSGGDKS